MSGKVYCNLLCIVFVSHASADSGVFIQRGDQNGLVCIEAENFKAAEAVEDHNWKRTAQPAGFSGAGCLTAQPDEGAEEDDPDYGDSPFVDYQVYFVSTGRHYVWVRGWGVVDGDTCHIDFDHRELDNGKEMELAEGVWSWVRESDDLDEAYFDVETPGFHTISLCMARDGAVLDKIILTPDPEYEPQDQGPAETIGGAVVEFAEPTRSAPENVRQSVLIPVRLAARGMSSLAVDYAVVGGSADQDDYQLAHGTLKFSPGNDTRHIELNVRQDDIDEPDETLTIQLQNPQGDGVQLGPTSSFVFTIRDPRPIVEWASATTGVTENEDSVDVTLALSHAFDQSVRVQAAVVGGDADDSDYSLPEDFVTFAPGQTESSLRVNISPDVADESTEMIELELTSPVNATLRGLSRHNIFICARSYQQLGGAYHFRYASGARWEKYAKIGGRADAMVRLLPGDDRLIFWRGASYRPFLDTAKQRSFVESAVPVRGDGEGRMFDQTNRFSHIRIVEQSSARVIVQWRYVPDFQRTDSQWWVEEYFTVYPNGVCVRAIREGAETLAEYHDPSHTAIQQLLFTDQGVCPLPKSWRNALEFDVDSVTDNAFKVIGVHRATGAFELQARQPGIAAPISLTAKTVQVHPALVVRGWGDADARVSINGTPIEDARVGVIPNLANDDLVIWLDQTLQVGDELTLKPLGGNPPVVRAAVTDPYLSEIPLLPQGSPDPGPFGAYYATLKYWDEWDESRRVGDYADVVVQFDQSPDRLVFWRGTTNVPHWVNESNHWYENEFCERRGGDSGLDGLCEPMQDHDSKLSNVRVIHSTPARAIVHWRYSPVTLDGQIPFVDETGWGDCVDEYHYVYPDETGVRDTTLYTSRPNVFNEWHEAIPLVNPGQTPEDCLDMEAIKCANLAGDVKVFDFQNGFPDDREFVDGYNILLVGLKGQAKPFAISESAGQWWDPISRPDDTRFNHYDDWPAWPEKYRRGDWDRDPVNNYREFWKFLPSHSSLMHLDWDNYESDLEGPVVYLRKILLNGMLAGSDVGSLVPLARYWEHAPLVRVSGYGFSGAQFDKAQKAYHIRRRISWIDEMVNRDDDKMVNQDADRFELEVLASDHSPVINPCFVIHNWPQDARARLKVDGQPVTEDHDFRQGIESNWQKWEPLHSLVIWFRSTSDAPITYTIEMIK